MLWSVCNEDKRMYELDLQLHTPKCVPNKVLIARAVAAC
jgi:hypothetical protein